MFVHFGYLDNSLNLTQLKNDKRVKNNYRKRNNYLGTTQT